MTPLTVHAESYINQFGVARQTAYQAPKRCLQRFICPSIQLSRKRERGANIITSRWVSQIAH